MMTPLRIFVSYTYKNITGLEKELTVQLLEDLRNAGVEIVTEEEILSEAGFLALLERELPHCQWFLLIQTAESIHSLRTQLAMNHALEHMKQHTMKGILRIVCPSSEAEIEPLRWSETRAYSFNGDYPRLRDKVLLDLDLLHIQDVISKRANMVISGEKMQNEAIDSKNPQSLPNDDALVAFAKQSDMAASGDRPAPLPYQKKPFFQQFRVLLIALVLLVLIATGSGIFLISRSQGSHSAATPTPTPMLSKVPYDPYKGVLILDDSLHNSNHGYSWQPLYTNDANGASCTFDNAYHVLETNPTRSYYCVAEKVPVKNFVFQVDMEMLKGDFGGIIFRSQGFSHYFFRIGQDGSYLLKLVTNFNTGAGLSLVEGKKSAAIKTGLRQHNLIAVVARGSSFEIYVNNTLIGTAHDDSYSQGLVGVFAEAGTNPTEVAFRDAKVWAL